MFSVSRDRRSLWSELDAADAEIRKEVLWNNFLVTNLMPKVWHDLLVDLTRLKSPVYDYFPLMPLTAGSLFNSLMDRVLERIIDAIDVRFGIQCLIVFSLIEDGFIPAKS